jgi:ribulose-5-phosphate 4-epimerase/fuculose-1-phosphate aldolase
MGQPVTSEARLRADIVEVGRRLYARGYTASNDGNISVRLDEGRLLMTPTGVCKGFMSPEMMCITDLDGRKLQGDRSPSSEIQMHLEVYRSRPDAVAVVHAHPPIATGFAVAGIKAGGMIGRRLGYRLKILASSFKITMNAFWEHRLVGGSLTPPVGGDLLRGWERKWERPFLPL